MGKMMGTAWRELSVEGKEKYTKQHEILKAALEEEDGGKEG